MTAKQIQDKLCKKFETHKYILLNSYLYDWECDFFSTTASKYHQEIEIKVSYSDFKADFKKEDKHRVLRDKFKGKKTILYNMGKTFRYSYEETKTLLENGRRVYDEENKRYKQTGTGKIINGKIQIANIENFSDDKLDFEYEQISTEINIRDLPKCPNKLYYICPKGVIPKEEVPEYAGLYYIDENFRITEIKKAPFIHKENINLDKELLDKFYWKSVNLENTLQRKTHKD